MVLEGLGLVDLVGEEALEAESVLGGAAESAAAGLAPRAPLPLLSFLRLALCGDLRPDRQTH